MHIKSPIYELLSIAVPFGVWFAGLLIYFLGYDPSLKPFLPHGCSSMTARVQDVTGSSSVFSPRSVDVKFAYNATAFGANVVRTCHVSMADDVYRVNSEPSIYVCNQGYSICDNFCETDESFAAYASLGAWMMASGGIAFFVAVVCVARKYVCPSQWQEISSIELV
jgi:hypothetical protein